jgi:hypothetical protein
MLAHKISFRLFFLVEYPTEFHPKEENSTRIVQYIHSTTIPKVPKAKQRIFTNKRNEDNYRKS